MQGRQDGSGDNRDTEGSGGELGGVGWVEGREGGEQMKERPAQNRPVMAAGASAGCS